MYWVQNAILLVTAVSKLSQTVKKDDVGSTGQLMSSNGQDVFVTVERRKKMHEFWLEKNSSKFIAWTRIKAPRIKARSSA